MAEAHKTPSSGNEVDSLKAELAELVRRSLIELGDMAAVSDRLKTISDRISAKTPLPVPPSQD